MMPGGGSSEGDGSSASASGGVSTPRGCGSRQFVAFSS